MNRIVVTVDADLSELIPGFLANRRADVGKLRAAMSASDWNAVRRIGHALKGVGGGYGFDTITDLGRDIEAHAGAGCDQDLVAAVDRLASYLDQIDVVYR